MEICCDLGEGYGNWTHGDDAELMQYITLANVATGGHAGDPMIMDKTIDLAVEAGVKVGAHPGFPDKLGFGRKIIPFEPEEMAAIVTYQVGALLGFLRVKKVELNHILTHGALYAYVAQNDAVAEAVARAIKAVAPGISFIWPAPIKGSFFAQTMISLGHTPIPIVTADMHYDANGKVLIERKKQVTDLDYARSQVQSVLTRKELLTDAGATIPVPEVTGILFHSDGPNAVDVAKVIRETVTLGASAPVGA